uniref:Uncharacterized protein n=1 Tax=Rhizophagus irregularis (strain DAOM 181602 / DAOM 197198 / MUCL 43194) TaxID=747089 RepID=U9T681_RHIID
MDRKSSQSQSTTTSGATARKQKSRALTQALNQFKKNKPSSYTDAAKGGNNNEQ